MSCCQHFNIINTQLCCFGMADLASPTCSSLSFWGGVQEWQGWCGVWSLMSMSSEEDLGLMEEILHQLRLVVYPIIYKVLYIPGAGFLPSTVCFQRRKDVGPKDPWRNHTEPGSYSRLPDRRVLAMLILNASLGFQPRLATRFSWLLFQVVVSKEFNIDSTNDMKCHCDGILGVGFDLPRCLFANYLYSCALLRPTVGVCETTMTLVQYPWARLARLSPTMANLGLSLSIPLSASVDAARAPQFFGKRCKSQRWSLKNLEEMIHILGISNGFWFFW